MLLIPLLRILNRVGLVPTAVIFGSSQQCEGRTTKYNVLAVVQSGILGQGDWPGIRSTGMSSAGQQCFSRRMPGLAQDVFVAPSAAVIGDVSLGNKASVWYGCVLKGDEGKISIGNNSNLQDGTVVCSATSGISGVPTDTIIGNNVTIGHNATLRACSIADASLIGMDATLLEGVQVESGALVAAGAVVQPNTTVAAGQVWGGNPARFIRDLKPHEKSFMQKSAEAYCALGADHFKATKDGPAGFAGL